MINAQAVRCLICVLALLILSISSFGAHAQTVGRTVGTYSVSPTGAATYTIPIFAPKGPAGLQPNIALVYNSQAGNGVMGVGWNLAGLSSIYRCNLTYAQDAAPAPVTLSTSDGYCLDGQRLRLTSGTYGLAGSTYQTEIANFENVTAYGTAGNGPAYFVIQSRDGRIRQYGNGGNSEVVVNGTALSWLLSEVSDPAGNTMTVAYCQTGTPQGANCPPTPLAGATVPSTISWTPTAHGASTYAYTMTFNYGTNPSTAGGGQPCTPYPYTSPGQPVPDVCILNGYVAGSAIQDAGLLNSITIAYNGSQVKQYVLTYTPSGTTGRDTLTKIQECATSTSDCLYPTTVSYQSGASGVATTASTFSMGSLANYYLAHYDFNGDGFKDLVYQNASTGTWYVAFGSTTGYGAAVSTGITTSAYLPGQGTTLFGDLLGNGKDGILANNGGTWYYYTWNGSSFTGVSTGVTYDSTAKAFALADTNGDGLPDLVSLNVSAASAIAYIRLNTSTSTPSFGAANSAFTATPPSGFAGNGGNFTTPDSQAGGPLRTFDFNGDGRNDLVVNVGFYDSVDKIHLTSSWWLLGNGSTFISDSISSKPTFFVNWNNDACTDYVTGSTLVISACNGNAASSTSLSFTPIGALDWDGDGSTDLLYNSGGYVYVQLANGEPPIATSMPASAHTYWGIDINGDGLDDLLAEQSDGITINYYLHNGGGTPPDLMSSITDGYGNFVKPAYASLVQWVNVYYFLWNDAQYPYKNYLQPLYVVGYTTYSDPTSPGGTYLIWNYYAAAWMNLQGRGFSGFGAQQVRDTRNNVYVYYGYDRAFPYTGMLTSVNATLANTNSQTLFSLTGTPQSTTLDGSQFNERYFPYIASESRNDYEVGGPKAWQLITTTATSYGYDNYGNATNISRTVTDEDSGSPYYTLSWTTTTTNTPDPNTSTWCLNLLTETQVAYSSTLSGSTSVTRTKTFTPDTSNCRYTQIVTEPSSSLYKVTESLGYDAFGNVNSDTITGINMIARQTTMNWGTTGQTPASVTDPTNATTNFGYDWRFALLSSVTDANLLTTSWTYNEFARKIQENRPDGTYTVWNYNNCVSWGGCLLGNNTLALAHYVYGYGGGLISDGTTYYDMRERSIIANNMLLASGTWDRRERRYDNLGRQSEEAAPCLWSSVTTTCTYWTTYSYDLLSRVTEVQRPINSTNGNLQTTTYTYEGRTAVITDPYSNTKTVLNDVNGWLRQTEDAYGYAVTLAYDSAGSKTSVTDSQSNTLWSGSYGYGLSAYLTAETDMDRGAWHYIVDALGERTAWTDAKGQSFGESYDALSRPLSRSEPDLFTQWTWGSTPSSHNVGKLASVCTGQYSNPTNCTSNPGYSETETYDSLGRLYQRAITLPPVGTFTYTSQYSATTGLPSSLTYPTSTNGCQVVVNYGYTNGILSSLTDGSNQTNCGSTGTVFWQANVQNPDGQITEETLGNGIVTNRTYDAVTHWLGSIQAGVGGGAGVKNLSFLYDEVGNVIQRQDNNLTLTESVHYDNDYRLSYTDLGSTQNLSISYDLNGNITSRSDVAAGATWTYDPNHKHAVTQAGNSSYTYAYDANGNMISRQGQTVSWSSYNYPISMSAGTGSTYESVYFSYGPDRQRWQQNYSGSGTQETTYYVGDLLEIINNLGVMNYRQYIYAGNEPIAIYSRLSSGTNSVNYVLSDHQGSVAALTNSSGATVVSESFTPFGNRRNPTTWSGAASNSDLATAAGITRQAYTFQTQLGLWMGMNHLNGRVEDSVVGRFLSADPNIPDAADPQSYNRYTYTLNNPLTYTDPSGFDAKRPQKIGGGDGPGDTNSGGTGDDGGSTGGTGGQADGGTVTVTANKWYNLEMLVFNLELDAILGPNHGTAGSGHDSSGNESKNPKNPKQPQTHCFNVSLGVMLSAAIPPGGGGGGGLSPLGISYGGSLLDTRLFVQSQAYGLVGLGGFLGVGVSLQGGPGAISGGLTTALGVHGEVDVGTPPSPVSFSVTGDWFPGSGGDIGGFHSALPGGRLGVGIGAFGGIGPTSQVTFGLPSLRDLINFGAGKLGIPGLQSQPTQCSK